MFICLSDYIISRELCWGLIGWNNEDNYLGYRKVNAEWWWWWWCREKQTSNDAFGWVHTPPYSPPLKFSETFYVCPHAVLTSTNQFWGTFYSFITIFLNMMWNKHPFVVGLALRLRLLFTIIKCRNSCFIKHYSIVIIINNNRKNDSKRNKEKKCCLLFFFLTPPYWASFYSW